ncbi:MAG: type II secretion system F family protein [Planctomycetaceae bacterium]
MRSQIRKTALAIACRNLATMLYSGVPVVRALELAGRKVGDVRCREAFADLALQVRSGEEISDAMSRQGRSFPPLVIDMVRLSEHSGALPEVLEHLADHFDNTVALRRRFVSLIFWPVLQFVLATGVIAVVIVVLGMLPGGEMVSEITFGLRGPGGAITFLAFVYGTLMCLGGGCLLASKVATARQIVDRLLLSLPVIGTCQRSFAIARFSWAYYLTQQTGMSIRESLRATFQATGNGAFQSKCESVCQSIEAGDSLTVALADTGLFPEDFIEMVDVGETSGTVPEQLERLSPRFREQAERSLRLLCHAIAWAVWGLVATFIVFFVFRFFLWYVEQINDALEGIQ